MLVGVLTAVQARINGQLGVAPGRRPGRGRRLVRLGPGHPHRAVGGAARRAAADSPRSSRGVRGADDPVVDAGGRRRGRAHRRDAGPRGRPSSASRCSRWASSRGRRCSGLVLDRIGYGPAGVVAVTVPRLVGGALALVAVGIALAGDGLRGIPLWMLAAAVRRGRRHRVAAGDERAAASARRHAADRDARELRRRDDRPRSSPPAVHVAVAGAARRFPTEPWLYLGGAIGVVYIFLSAALVRPHRRAAARARRRSSASCSRRSRSTRSGRRRRARARCRRSRWSLVALLSVARRDARRWRRLLRGLRGVRLAARPCAASARRAARASTALRRPCRARGGLPPT